MLWAMEESSGILVAGILLLYSLVFALSVSKMAWGKVTWENVGKSYLILVLLLLFIWIWQGAPPLKFGKAPRYPRGFLDFSPVSFRSDEDRARAREEQRMREAIEKGLPAEAPPLRLKRPDQPPMLAPSQALPVEELSGASGTPAASRRP